MPYIPQERLSEQVPAHPLYALYTTRETERTGPRASPLCLINHKRDWANRSPRIPFMPYILDTACAVVTLATARTSHWPTWHSSRTDPDTYCWPQQTKHLSPQLWPLWTRYIFSDHFTYNIYIILDLNSRFKPIWKCIFWVCSAGQILVNIV